MPEYFVETEKFTKVAGAWDCLRVKIFVRENPDAAPSQIGAYERNYHTFYSTFHSFMKDDRWYALYSPDYTATRIMELPSCCDLGGEEPSAHGFCPVDYYVPNDAKLVEAGLAGTIGFVAGCIWGDDSSWKIEYLDLSGVSSGRLKRDARFGYIEMPTSLMSLRDCVSFYYFDPKDHPFVDLALNHRFDLNTGKREVDEDLDEDE